ncbi:molybdenum cofactor guanylyltransferase [Thalassoroseus pseudoceratinae]|uniref:molybdenum cofactor guanylyltransferase n=1 Tax=Thalassoroseus pseudoceratinae TaxID=2713176 RepID=UPI0014212E95|nr:molybdenum cofactor guanylyltransferase [Thalassoroseus pseudoceratinae]
MSDRQRSQFGGIVLCGGRSQRMGRPKLSLPFGDETMLGRVVRVLSEVVTPIVVVAAVDQELPTLPSDVIITRDEQPDLGPLAGLAAGLKALPTGTPAAYASSCDVPLLKPEFISYLVNRFGDADVLMPREGKFHHPLAGVYRSTLEPTIREMLAHDQRRPVGLLERCRSVTIDVDELRAVDSELDSLRNTNTPEEYHAALMRAERDDS